MDPGQLLDAHGKAAPDQDPGESTNVAERNPDVIKRLLDYAERARADLGDSLTNRTGSNVRAAGRM